ncbi:unnamed protein product [Acanthoscelides obtectus]|uniref:MADF domain-containing protein n=1 Tax=Acanthoscelides obtectus TaxID=200917 RepID=A0A9P0KWW3_ACAOB|nr:unnamed protein product [Acanthoscelides obtectus]CAK1624721.1 hypothetical protein AOBTE_LOCUS2723 [Acanthoscelides obtectus]
MSVDVELLISSIQERPPLWDQSNKKYMDRDVAINLWKEVAAEFNTTNIIAKKKWKHLRDRFRNELKKECKPKSGDAQGSPCKPQWKWFKNMEFLRETLSSRSMEGNLKNDFVFQSQRETESIDGGVMSCPQSPTDVSISSAPSSSLSSSVGRKRKVTAAEEGERLHIEKEKLDIMKSMAKKEDE